MSRKKDDEQKGLLFQAEGPMCEGNPQGRRQHGGDKEGKRAVGQHHPRETEVGFKSNPQQCLEDCQTAAGTGASGTLQSSIDHKSTCAQCSVLVKSSALFACSLKDVLRVLGTLLHLSGVVRTGLPVFPHEPWILLLHFV